MRPVIAALLLVILTACGGSSSDTPENPKPSETASSGVNAQDETCAKLGRTWAVAADGLHSSLTLAAMDSVDSTFDAMTAATDQMKIEQCEGDIVLRTAEGNFEASLLVSEALVCSREAEIRACPAGEKWQTKGAPIVAEVESLSAR
jgi:hypothetical protein